jgi:hypothetical protein
MVVMRETLLVRMKIRVQTEIQIRVPRMVDSFSLISLSVRESGDTSPGSGVCLLNAAKVLGDEDNRGVLSEPRPLAAMVES